MVNLCHAFLDEIQDPARGSDHHMHYKDLQGKIKKIQKIYTLLLILPRTEKKKKTCNFIVYI